MNMSFGSNIGRRLLALVLSVALVLALLPAVPATMADETVQGKPAGEGVFTFSRDGDLNLSCVYVPAFLPENVPGEGDGTQSDDWPAQDMPVYEADDLNGMCEVYKERILAHESPFGVTVPFEVPLEMATQEDKNPLMAEISAFLNDAANSTVAYSLKHTGVPNEGDYIKFQTGVRNFAISVGSSASVIGDVATLQLTVKFKTEYFTTLEQEQQVTDRLGEVMGGLGLAGKSTYDKLKIIHDWIVKNNTYDHEHVGDQSYRTQYTAYGALIDQTSVCQGYTVLFYRMCLEAGIDVRAIAGIATTETESGRHSWNIVRIDGLYYIVDTTWDDPTVEGSSEGTLRWDYFLKGSATVAANRTPDDEYLAEEFVAAYPISETDYVRSYYDDITDDSPSLVKASLSLGAQFGMNVFLKLPEIAGCDYADSYVVFFFNFGEEPAEIDRFDPDDRSQDGRLYKFTVHVSSIQMADVITAEFHYIVDGTEHVINQEGFTVEEYLDSAGLTENASVELIDLVNAIRSYGFQAQLYLSEYAKTPWVLGDEGDHRPMRIPDNPPWDVYDPEYFMPYMPQIERRAEDVEGLSISLTLDTDTAINIFVKTESGYSGDIFVIDSGTGTPYDAVQVSDGRYKITIPGIAAHQLADPHEVLISTDKGETAIIDVSALSFVCLTAEDGKPAKDVACALYEYYVAARAYQDSLAD